MSKMGGAVSSWLRDLFRTEDSRLMRAELHLSLGTARVNGIVKTLVWYLLAGAGVLLMSILQ